MKKSTQKKPPLDVQTTLQMASEGEPSARKIVNNIAAPYIEFQTDRFCRRFCNNSYQNARCTLSPPQGISHDQTSLCDKANASYTWMLEELTNEKRLKNIRAESDAQIASYFKAIVNSLPFYERWKNWRFNRRIHVPAYISDIDTHAKTIFLQLQSKTSYSLIAQNLGLSENVTREIVDKILIELTKRKRLHLLTPSLTQSLSEPTYNDLDDQPAQSDVEDEQFSPERLVYSLQLQNAWKQLTDVEQFIVEALVIEDQDANIVLESLARLKIPLGKNLHHRENDRQQLYYIKRKTLEKMQKILK